MAERKRKTSGQRLTLTVDDVARKAGVSRTAVSYVLNERGKRNTHVSEETRAKVLQAIQELDFRPHALARALSTGRSDELVVIMDLAFTSLAMELTASFQDHALNYGYTPVWYFTQGISAERKKILYQTIFARRPPGIFTTAHAFSPEDVALAHQMGVEQIIFLSFQKEPLEGIHSIVFPSQALGYLAAQHLLERGHRSLALVRPDEAIQTLAFYQRLEGMQEALAAYPDAHIETLALCPTASEVYALVERVFSATSHPTGIYAFNDEYALTLLSTLIRLGLRVPQDVALVGTDNLALCERVWPTLTSICFDALDIGKRAVEMFAALHQGLPLAEDLTRPLLPRLISRASS